MAAFRPCTLDNMLHYPGSATSSGPKGDKRTCESGSIGVESLSLACVPFVRVELEGLLRVWVVLLERLRINFAGKLLFATGRSSLH